MRRTARAGIAAVFAATLGLGVVPLLAAEGASAAPTFTPGSNSAGDPYYPLDGNGGYDVQHYGLNIAYQPSTDKLTGVATITAIATQNLSRFDLDLDGLTVRAVAVGGSAATWTRTGQELVITPAAGLVKGKTFTTVVAYDGVPQTIADDELGDSGVFHTEKGMIIAGQPHGAATWFPVNDHPSDKATYTFRVVAPKDLQVIANGVQTGKKRLGSVTAWTWEAKEPMASYLATVDIGDFDITSYRSGGKSYVDAIDKSLITPFAKPRTGSQYAFSGAADSSYKRLTRIIAVPAGGATVSFQAATDVESSWDFAFVEVHTVGQDDWTTLPDLNGHTTSDVGNSCTFENWLQLHPFLAHYQTYTPGATDDDEATCTATGTTGTWSAYTGTSDGYEPWKVDLSAYQGKTVELSISYASDEIFQQEGVFIDDLVVSTGAGTTGFEDDGNTLDGWTVPGAPAGSPGNETDWAAGPAQPRLTGPGPSAQASLKEEPRVIAFLSKNFGAYPFSAVGGIVPDEDRLGFALETQTRPVYSPFFFGGDQANTSVIVHENTHQWFGDSLALYRWKDIWLNEGFATYAEWLWSEHEGNGTAQEIFDNYASIPADDGFWTVTVGDPGPDKQFDGAVYDRGAMTLHALRTKIGDQKFFALLKTWAAQNKGKNVTTAQFIALAEKISGQDLDSFFQVWVYTPAKPAGIEPAGTALSKVKVLAPGSPHFGDRAPTAQERHER